MVDLPYLPLAAGSSTKFKTQQNPFQGNALQNSISAVSDITADFYTNFHTFGVDWYPAEYLRWYIDGTMVGRPASCSLSVHAS